MGWGKLQRVGASENGLGNWGNAERVIWNEFGQDGAWWDTTKANKKDQCWVSDLLRVIVRGYFLTESCSRLNSYDPSKQK